jgi:hypothetical protein
MSNKKFFNSADFQHKLAIKNAIINPFVDLAAMNTLSTAQGYGNAQAGILAYNLAEKVFYQWNGTAWVTSDKDEEVLVSSDVTFNGTATPTDVTLTQGSNIIYHKDAEGDVTTWLVTDPTGTPTFKRIDDDVINLGSATDFDPTKPDTIQYNDEGKVWAVDDDGTAVLINDGIEDFYSEWTDFSLVVGDNIFDISNGSATESNYVTGYAAPTKALLKNSVVMDVADEQAVVLVKASSTTQFIVNTDIATTGTITAQYPAKKI